MSLPNAVRIRRRGGPGSELTDNPQRAATALELAIMARDERNRGHGNGTLNTDEYPQKTAKRHLKPSGDAHL